MKRVALINDLSGFGRCSLTAAIPVISTLGVQAVPLPTAVLSAQTGFGDYACKDLTSEMVSFADQWTAMGAHFDGIYSGYLANTDQLSCVRNFLERFHSSDTLYLADPVMGDSGHRFPMFQDDFLEGMRELTGLADVITPNLTEACLLAGESYEALYVASASKSELLDQIKELAANLQAQALRPQTVVITGILWQDQTATTIGNLALSCSPDQTAKGNLSQPAPVYVESLYTGTSYSGTGDLFASVICGCLLRGLTVADAMKKAASFLEAAISDAQSQQIPRNEGVPFESHLEMLHLI